MGRGSLCACAEDARWRVGTRETLQERGMQKHAYRWKSRQAEASLNPSQARGPQGPNALQLMPESHAKVSTRVPLCTLPLVRASLRARRHSAANQSSVDQHS